MNPDVYLFLAYLWAEEGRRDGQKARPTRRHPALRQRLGWRLVEVGLRLAQSSSSQPSCSAASS
jgi:hypothetical protein